MKRSICYLVVMALVLNLCIGGTAVFADSQNQNQNQATFTLSNLPATDGDFITDGNPAISLLQTGKLGLSDSEATSSTVGEVGCYGSTKQMYFAVKSAFMNHSEKCVKLDITYYDNSTSDIQFKYQNGEGAANWWKGINISRKGTNEWLTKTVVLTDAYWPGNQQNRSGLSFRIGGGSADAPVYIQKVSIEKLESIEPLSAIYYFGEDMLTSGDVKRSADGVWGENSYVTETVGPEDDLRVAGKATGTDNSKYLYFQLSSSFITKEDNCVKLKVTYLDNSSSDLNLTYHSTSDMHQKLTIPRTNTGKWMQRLIYIYDASWPGTQQGRDDVSFRIGTASSDNPAYISCVEVSKTELSKMPPKGSASITFGEVCEVNSNTNETIWINQNDESCQGLAEAPDGTQAMFIESGSKYIWVCVSSKFVGSTQKNVAVRVTYYDDSANDLNFSATTDDGMWGYAGSVKKTGSNSWKTADFYLTDAAWPGRLNGRDNCSFRVGGNKCYVKNITLMKYERSADVSATLSGDDEVLDPDEMLTAAATDAAEYVWLVKDGKEYVSVPGKNGEHSISYGDEGKTFAAAAIKADGTVVMSEAEYGPVNTIGWVSTTSLTRPKNFVANTPKKNVFKTEDSSKEFILLDVKNNNDSKFLILSKDFYGQHAFTEGCTSNTGTSDERKFDSENEKNVAYWLNNGFLEQENTIPTEIQKYINFDYYWKTEPRWYTTNSSNSTATKAGIALMSAWEQEKYITEFGYMDSLPNDTSWLLRTAFAGQYHQSAMAINTGGNRVNLDMTRADSYIRPEFHLNRDFFKEVRIDLSSAGSNVIKAMKENYTLDEMKAIYSEPELVTAFDAAAQGTDYAHIDFSNGKTGTNILVAEPSGKNDAACTVTQYENENCCALEYVDGKPQYMYFVTSTADGNFNRESRNMTFYIKYLDNGTAPITLQYNSGYNDLLSKDYKEISWDKTNTGEWITKKITVTDAKFMNKQNHNADFRLVSAGGETLYVANVMVSAGENTTFESIELLPQAPGSVFEVGEVSFDLSVYKNNSETAPYDVYYSIKDEITGSVLSNDGYIQISAANNVAASGLITPEITKAGIYTISAEIYCGERTVGTVAKKFGAANFAQEGAMNEISPFGINVHSQDASSDYFAEQTELLKNLGFKTIRDCYTQSAIEEKGWGELNRIANAWIDKGGKWCSILGGKKYDFTIEENVNAFASYCGAFAAKYPQIETFEISNEPDIASFWEGDINAAAYANVVKKASEAIKAANPSAKVIAGVAGNKGNGYSGNYVSELFENGIYPYIDVFSHHPYFRQDPKDGFVDYAYENGTKELEEMGGWKEVYLTETGVSSANGNEIKQAEYNVKTLVLADVNGYGNIMLYNFIDTNDNKSDWNGSLGIMYSNFTPKPAMIAVAQLNNAVAGAPFIGSMDISGAENYLFDYNGTPVMVAWASGSEAVNAEFGENVTVKDMYGNAVSTAKTAKIGSEPVYIYGISESELVSAAKGTINSAYADWKTTYGELMNANSKVDSQTGLINGAAAELLAAHYEAGGEMLSENAANIEVNKTAMLAMEKWQKIGERIAAYCGAVSAASEAKTVNDIQSGSGLAGDIASRAQLFADKAAAEGLSLGIQNANAVMANGLGNWAKAVSDVSEEPIQNDGTITIKGADGNVLEAIPSDAAFTISVPLNSSYKSDKTVSVICGIYSADKKLLKASVISGKTLSANAETNCEFGFDANGAFGEAAAVRVFVLEGLGNLKPETTNAFDFKI